MRAFCIGLMLACLALTLYTYFGYPVVLWLWARWRRRPVQKADSCPSVSVLVVAYNEADALGRKIPNLLALDYPPDRLEIVIASDGSDDRTADVVAEYAEQGVRLLKFTERRGKAPVLNEAVPQCSGDIVVLADARQRFDPAAVRALVANFGDPGVGCVSGELVFRSDPKTTAVGRGLGAYWSYEKTLRKNESAVFGTVGATGAIYAIRRDLFAPIPQDTLVDDVAVPMAATAKGYRTVFEPAAVAYDTPSLTGGAEFRRKVRTLAGNFQILSRNPRWFSPFRCRVWFQLVSHKLCRLLAPLFLVGILLANLPLAGERMFQWTLAVQVCFYLVAVAGWVLCRAGSGRPRSAVLRWLTLPYVFVLLHLAVVVGFFAFATGRQSVTWVRSESD